MLNAFPCFTHKRGLESFSTRPENMRSYFRCLAHLLCGNDAAKESTWGWQIAPAYPRKNPLDFWFLFFYFPFANRNALNEFHKMRRHLNEPRASKPTNSIKQVLNRPTYSSSQLNVKVSELHAGANGRLEISCVSTIPAKVGKGDAFADFKSYNVKSKRWHLFSFLLKHDLSSQRNRFFHVRKFREATFVLLIFSGGNRINSAREKSLQILLPWETEASSLSRRVKRPF